MIIEVVGKEIEKIKGDFESYLNGLNMVGEISYSQYSELYDEGTKQIQKAYELGKSEFEKENTELKKQLEMSNKVYNDNLDYSHHIEEQLTKAKEILREYIRINLLPPIERNFDDEVKLFKQAEQFISEVEK